MEDIESTRWCDHGKRCDDYCDECNLEYAREDIKQKAKKFIDANVWDGEDRIGAKNDRATFTPDDLQELIFQLIDSLDT